MQSEINIGIGDKEPAKYFSELFQQCTDKSPVYGAMTDEEQMRANFKMHCIPDGMEHMEISHYEDFLIKRRRLMAIKIRDYYQKL